MVFDIAFIANYGDYKVHSVIYRVTYAMFRFWLYIIMEVKVHWKLTSSKEISGILYWLTFLITFSFTDLMWQKDNFPLFTSDCSAPKML